MSMDDPFPPLETSANWYAAPPAKRQDQSATPDNLAAWLTKVWDEDEAVAIAASPGPWEWLPEDASDDWGDSGPNLARVELLDTQHQGHPYVVSSWGHDAWGVTVSEADKAHIARHDPAAVLARIAADRQILASCLHAISDEPADAWYEGASPVRHADRIVRLLALPYADRPGYREEWRP